jgi:ketosteroid isomerase-like protein
MGQHHDFARDVFAAIDARDYDRVSELLLPDCEVVVPGFSGRGPQALIDWMDSILAAMPDLRHEIVTVAGDGDIIASETRVRATHTEVLRGPAGDVAPSGRALDMQAACAFSVAPDAHSAAPDRPRVGDDMPQLGTSPAAEAATDGGCRINRSTTRHVN